MLASQLASHFDASAVRDGSGALYTRIAAELRRLIESGELPAGTQLPAERALSADLDVSRVTVASAYRHLRNSGWLTSQQGAGTFVSPSGLGDSWGSLVGTPAAETLEFVNAAPSASPLLIDAVSMAADLLPLRVAGSGYVSAGLPELRESIASYYCRRGLETTADEILVTAGATDAAHAVLATVAQPGNRVLVEHPTYPGAVELVSSAGGRCIPVTVDPSDPDEFVAAADRAARQNAPTSAYFMPDFSNPTGNRLPLQARRRLSATMHRHGVLTIVDEVAADLSLDGSPDIEPFGASTPAAATVTIGSVSKTVWGGVRVGWVRAEQSMLARIAETYARRQLSVSVMDQIVTSILLDRYDEVRRLRSDELRAGRDHAVALIRDRLPNWTFRVPAGGMSLWCELPDGVRSSDLVAAAQSRGLLLAPGLRFGTGYSFDDFQRIPFTRSLTEITAAVDILATLGPVHVASERVSPSRPNVVV